MNDKIAHEGSSRLSRRNFLKGAGVLTGAAAMAAMASCAPQSGAQTSTLADTSSITWDYEADIIVCGGGGGLLAACDAADAGNEVILLEKAPSVGGESSVNEAWINGAGTSVQKAEGVEDGAETQAADYAQNHAAHINNIDQDLLAEYCAESGASIERLIELGCEYKLAQDTMFYTTVPRAHLLQPDASAWGRMLGQAAEGRGVNIMTSTPMTEIITDATGKVIGVKSEGITFKARKAVILATGDVSGNARMKMKFQPDWANIDACIPQNTGDGLFAALALGADSSFDQFTAVGPCLMYEPRGSVVVFYQILKGLIVVNNEGKRFGNEDDTTTLAGLQAAQPEGQAFMVFDSRIANISRRPDCPTAEINAHVFAGECAELGLLSGIGPAYLDDYLAEDIAVEAATLEELAQAVGIDSAGLTRTVEAWNAAVNAGVDEEFGRAMTGALQFGDMVTLEEGPFYALKLRAPKWMCTEGPNLMVNTDMSVLDVEGNPIDRLYACGAGIMSGTATLYANSCGDHMGITAFSARRAAARASALEPWEA